MTRRLLIRGGTVLTLGARSSNLVEGDVLVADGRIAEVGRSLRARDAEIVDASATVVMPGFVDTHRHTWRSLLRNLGTPGTTTDLGRHYAPDDVYAATLLGLVSAAETGITTVVDWADVHLEDRYTDAALQAHADSGLRTVFVHAAPAWAETGDVDPGALGRLAQRPEDGAAPALTVAAGMPGPGSDTPERLASAWGEARSLGLRIHAHTGTEPGHAGTVAELGSRGLLGPDVTLVHCCHLDGIDLDAIASHGVAVSLTPASEMAKGLGTPLLQQFIDHDIRPGLGVDDETVAPGDLFTQMRSAQSIQHAVLFDRKLAGKGSLPNLLGTREVIRYATVDGARVAGLADVTGSLEPGKQADIVLLRTDRPNIHPVNDPIGAVVWGMDASNVDSVFVAGRPVVRDGRATADVARVRRLAIEARERLAGAAGRLATSGAGS